MQVLTLRINFAKCDFFGFEHCGKLSTLFRAVVVVKWSAYLPSIRQSEFETRWRPHFLSVKIVFEKNENKQKEAGVGPLKKPYNVQLD